MLYTGDFVLRYYVGFSQIRSQLCYKVCTNVVMSASVSLRNKEHAWFNNLQISLPVTVDPNLSGSGHLD